MVVESGLRIICACSLAVGGPPAYFLSAESGRVKSGVLGVDGGNPPAYTGTNAATEKGVQRQHIAPVGKQTILDAY